VPERDALMTALQVATVDWISNGRFLFGIGAGWLEEEMRLFTPHFEHRFAYMKEAVAAMHALWGEDGASFDGQWIKFPKVVCRPKPVQQPGPPVLIGGMGPNVLKRVGAWGDGWAPIGIAPDGLAQARADIGKHARAAGRDPSKLTITAMLGVVLVPAIMPAFLMISPALRGIGETMLEYNAPNSLSALFGTAMYDGQAGGVPQLLALLGITLVAVAGAFLLLEKRDV